MSSMAVTAVSPGEAAATSGKHVVAAAISPREKFIYVLCEDGVVRVLDAATGEEVATVTPPPGAPVGVAHHPSANVVATWSETDVAHLWTGI